MRQPSVDPLPSGPGEQDHFLQTDPVGYEDDLNPYAYVSNDPLNRADPTGTFVCGDSPCPEEVVTAVADIATAAANTSNPQDHARLQQLSNTLGREGDPGVNIIVGETRRGAMEADVSQEGTITVTISPDEMSSRQRHPAYNRNDFAGKVGHETRHGIDMRALGNRRPNTENEERATERNATRDQMAISRGLATAGVGASHWAWGSYGSTDDEIVNNVAEGSVSLWCSGNPTCQR